MESPLGEGFVQREQSLPLVYDEDEPSRKRLRQGSNVTSSATPSSSILSSPQQPTVTQNFTGNQLYHPKARLWTKVYDPTTQKLLTRVPESTLSDIHAAVTTAETAGKTWAAIPPTKRRQKLLALHNALLRRETQIKHTLSVEVGKTFAESAAEFERGMDAIETACGVVNDIYGKHLMYHSRSTYTIHEPLGVCVSITPFNFPFLTPLWSIPFAIITGNTVIVKPSEKAPTVTMHLAECFLEADFPPGVFNILHGSAAVAEKLIIQPAVRAVNFVGTRIAAESVCEQASKAGKRVHAECDGKNHGVVLEDAHKSQTLSAIVGSAFGLAGQRCMALSVVVFVGSTREWLCDLVELAKSLKVGQSLDPTVVIGPLITVDAKKRVESVIENATAEGARLVLDGRDVHAPDYPDGNFIGPTIISEVESYMQCYQEEVFGPVLVCVQVDSLEEAIDTVNENRYGNSCMLFTNSPRSAQTFQEEVNVGQIGINVPLIAHFGPVTRTCNKDSVLGNSQGQERSSWQHFTSTKTITALWR